MLEIKEKNVLLHTQIKIGKDFLCPFDNANRQDAYNTAVNTQGTLH